MKEFIKKNKNKITAFIYFSILIIGCVRGFYLDSQEVMTAPVANKSIILDAGHGGWDPGKVVGETKEKDINLKISDKLLAYLEQGGCIVTPTRNADTALDKDKRGDLKARTEFAKSAQGDMLISVHQNFYPKASVKGAQVFYYKNSEESKALAELIQKRLCELDGTNTRVAKANGEYYLLKKTEIPAVIIECGFLSNQEEKEKLNSEEYQSELAWAIYLGISDYYSKEDC